MQPRTSWYYPSLKSASLAPDQKCIPLLIPTCQGKISLDGGKALRPCGRPVKSVPGASQSYGHGPANKLAIVDDQDAGKGHHRFSVLILLAIKRSATRP